MADPEQNIRRQRTWSKYEIVVCVNKLILSMSILENKFDSVSKPKNNLIIWNLKPRIQLKMKLEM
jgi:hypothetical protein